MDQGLGRSPTFLVGNEKQRHLLAKFKRNEQQFSEGYQTNKPLCFNGRGYQKTHPKKVQQGRTDADATLVCPMLLGVADGVSQIEDFGIDPSELPNDLLIACEELAEDQLFPGQASGKDAYRGPIPLMREAFEATESLGSTTILLTIMDNSTQIHGKLHPMMAVMSIGDCELLILRRTKGRQYPLEAVFHTEMQRIDGHAQTPLQVARVDDRVDPEFREEITIDVIERGSAVHCVSAYEGDIVVQGSDGVFDNLFLDEIVNLCNQMLPLRQPGAPFLPTHPDLLEEVAQRVVHECHFKATPGPQGQLQETPIGRGGKVDDTSCVVGEVIPWTARHEQEWYRNRRHRQLQDFIFCGWGSPTGFRCGGREDTDENSSDNER